MFASILRAAALNDGDREHAKIAVGMIIRAKAKVSADEAVELTDRAIPYGEEALLDTPLGFQIIVADALLLWEQGR